MILKVLVTLGVPVASPGPIENATPKKRDLFCNLGWHFIAQGQPRESRRRRRYEKSAQRVPKELPKRTWKWKNTIFSEPWFWTTLPCFGLISTLLGGLGAKRNYKKMHVKKRAHTKPQKKHKIRAKREEEATQNANWTKRGGGTMQKMIRTLFSICHPTTIFL